MKIVFTKITWYSQLAAIIIFIGVFCLGYYLGGLSRSAAETTLSQTPASPADSVINHVVFMCDNNQSIDATFFSDRVELMLSDGRSELLPHALSADGARYANEGESFVFWNKGNTAFIQEKGKTTYANCAVSQ